MIFVTLANALFKVFSTLLSFINIPGFPEELTSKFGAFCDLFINNGMSLLTFLIPAPIIRIGFPLIIVLIFSEQLYALVMWIVKKIPMLGMQ